MPKTLRLLLAGATGLIGGEVVDRLLGDAAWQGRLLVPARRALPRSDPRLRIRIGSLDESDGSTRLREELATLLEGEPLDTFISCLGTTLKTAGSREAFIAVDRELVLRLAGIARDLGARRAILVSSVGASRQSGNFYLRVKGEVEDEFERGGFERLDILRPGLLMGDRQERRSGEAAARRLAPWVNPLMIGRKLRRYRAIEAEVVARAIVRLCDETEPGIHMHEFDSIRRWAGA
ncbi:NAD-dependent epimerase/dehydratase family protein [Arenimonas sp.]|uniref:NAD-dependent epimerase/dehydratase family protein n=1 Tax=Arenimonas sp. TaxID=1872635 RepID=UPI0039E4D062